MLGASTCAKQPPANGVAVLTNMQWFYGPTWGSTLRVCEKLSPMQRRGGCAKEAEVRARQLELIEVLRRNVVHEAVVEVHVLLGEAAPVRKFLARLPWFERHGCKLHLVETGTRPRFVDYMRHLSSKALLGKTVVLTNQDVLLANAPWAALPTALPPKTAFFLSRYHTRYQYDTAQSLSAGVRERLFNVSSTTRSTQANTLASHLRGFASTALPPLARGRSLLGSTHRTGRGRWKRRPPHWAKPWKAVPMMTKRKKRKAFDEPHLYRCSVRRGPRALREAQS